MAEGGTAPALLGFRAEEHAVRILFGGDASAEGRALVESLMEHEAYRAAFHLVVRARGEGLNAAWREALLASPGYALARTLIEQGERRHGPVSEETQAAQASLLETQERARWETDGIDWGEVDAAIEAIEARDRAFAAQAASKAPSPAAAGRATSVKMIAGPATFDCRLLQLAEWAYKHFDFLKYKPTIVVDLPFNPFEQSATGSQDRRLQLRHHQERPNDTRAITRWHMAWHSILEAQKLTGKSRRTL